MDEPTAIEVPWNKYTPTKSTIAQFGVVMYQQREYPIRWDINGEKITVPTVVNL